VQRCRGLAGRNSQLASPIHLVTNSYVPNAWAMALCGFQHLIAFGTGSRMASYRVNTCPDYDPRILTRLHCKLFSVHDLTYVRNEWPHATIKGSGVWLYVSHNWLLEWVLNFNAPVMMSILNPYIF
jgi:hypothetical protein